MVFSKPLGIWLGAGAETIEEGSKVDAAFLLALFCSGVIVLLKRRYSWSKALRENPWLTALIGYMLISCLWSASDLFVSFKRWSRELIAIVMSFVVASEPHPRKALETLFRRTVYMLVPLSLILINYFPQYGRMYVHQSGDLMWIGAAMHKNQLAQLSIFAMLFLTWMFIGEREVQDTTRFNFKIYISVFIMFIALWIVGGPEHRPTYSATATVAFLVGLATFIGLLWYKKQGSIPGRQILSAVVVIIIIYGTVTPMIGRLSLIDISSTLGREQSLTGRADVWRQVVPVAMQRPILGHGFGGFWTTSARGQFEISDSHNGYLGLILELGFFGLALYVMFILSSLRKAHRVLTQDFDWGALWIGYLVMGLLINTTECSFSSLTSRIMAVILFLTVTSTTTPSNTLDVLPKYGS